MRWQIYFPLCLVELLAHLLLLQDEIWEIVSPAFDRFSPSGLPAAAQPVGEYVAQESFTKWKPLIFSKFVRNNFFQTPVMHIHYPV